MTDENGNQVYVADPSGKKSIESLKNQANMLKNIWGWENYRMVSPFEFDIAYTVDGSKDQIDFMSRYVNVWCPKFYSFTPRVLKSVVGSKFTQTSTQDANFGDFESRMDAYVAEGDELWAYVSCEPQYTSPYQNILLFNDGTEARTMFWTYYGLDVTGFLYWREDYYGADNTNTYVMRVPFSTTGPGDGILFYPGAIYGQYDPIPSIRFINMRDGIEDYQMLSMLESIKGEAYTKELTSHIVTSTLTYTKDDDVVYNVHSYLLRMLESAE